MKWLTKLQRSISTAYVKLWKHNGDLSWKWLPRLLSWEQPGLSHHATQNFSFRSCSVFMQCKPWPQVLYSKSKNYFLSWPVGIFIKARKCWEACLFKRDNKRWKSRWTFLQEKLWGQWEPERQCLRVLRLNNTERGTNTNTSQLTLMIESS